MKFSIEIDSNNAERNGHMSTHDSMKKFKVFWTESAKYSAIISAHTKEEAVAKLIEGDYSLLNKVENATFDGVTNVEEVGS